MANVFLAGCEGGPRATLTELFPVRTIIRVEIEFDPQKDEANRKKHAVSLDLARELDWNAMQVTADDADEHGEERWIGIAPKGDRLYTTVYTIRGEDTMRIISLRQATNAEIERYEHQGKRQGKIQAQQRRRRGPHKGRHKGGP
jgi:uncharacterized DUF497 family protein